MKLFGFGIQADIVELRGLKLLVPTATMEFFGPRVNIVGYVNWCGVCVGRPASVRCRTENTEVCHECLKFCENKLHVWEVLSVKIKDRPNNWGS